MAKNSGWCWLRLGFRLFGLGDVGDADGQLLDFVLGGIEDKSGGDGCLHLVLEVVAVDGIALGEGLAVVLCGDIGQDVILVRGGGGGGIVERLLLDALFQLPYDLVDLGKEIGGAGEAEEGGDVLAI